MKRFLDIFIQLLIISSLITFAIGTLPELNKKLQYSLYIFEVFTIIVFTVEYLIRFFFAGNKVRFVFSFYGLIDLLAVLPFYISIGIDLRSLRIFRLFRLFRILKLVRYSYAINRFKTALLSIKEELMIFSAVTIILLYVSSVGIYYFEYTSQPEVFKSVFHCLWWSVVTLTTVGYGDAYPVTVGGKVFTFVILMLGLGIVAIPAGLLASALSGNKR